MIPLAQIAQTPFVQIALPIVITLIVAAWNNNKRFDDMNRRFDDMNHRFDAVDKRFDRIEDRLERIETKLDDDSKRIAVLEERTSPLRGR